jgi:hypothetical protein
MKHDVEGEITERDGKILSHGRYYQIMKIKEWFIDIVDFVCAFSVAKYRKLYVTHS